MSRMFDPRSASTPAELDAHTPAGRDPKAPDPARPATPPTFKYDGFAKIISGLNEEQTVTEMMRLYQVERHRILFFITRLRALSPDELAQRGLTPEGQTYLRTGVFRSM